MKNILVAGAGKSSAFLIDYLLNNAAAGGWIVTVLDGSAEAIDDKIRGHQRAVAAPIDITNAAARRPLVEAADLVVSLMPAHLHILLAEDCLAAGKSIITSSYASPEMLALDSSVRAAGLLFLCEMGLDPGIDHMSASKMVHGLEAAGATILDFKSYCGGLVAPESDTNPWRYKIAWNPRNIMLAGKGGARFLKAGEEESISYENLFSETGTIEVAGLGTLAYYANRDSLRYPELYHVPNAQTFLRATLRYPVFCAGWNAVIALGLTDETKSVGSAETWAQLLRNVTGATTEETLEMASARFLGAAGGEEVIDLLRWLGLFDEFPLPAGAQTVTDALLPLLEEKWKLEPADRDLVVMQHEARFEKDGEEQTLYSTLVLEGSNQRLSAMAKTVGLPMALAAHRLMDGNHDFPKGVHIPNVPTIYEPILEALEAFDITFKERLS
jgi:saccharopine dehydrogenase-like NADP-dependent oxidoreductase